ncbi:hypothetical protein SUGI_0054670 [Cryptomeria japonica]|nr:hypothetical protein SUGI_0054670 [Cryptomeria japonica]
MILGDGRGQTIIASRSNVKGGSTAFRSRTLAASGKGFIIRDMTFTDLAEPDKNQAVGYVIHPTGWLEWFGNYGLERVYYGVYVNTDPAQRWTDKLDETYGSSGLMTQPLGIDPLLWGYIESTPFREFIDHLIGGNGLFHGFSKEFRCRAWDLKGAWTPNWTLNVIRLNLPSNVHNLRQWKGSGCGHRWREGVGDTDNGWCLLRCSKILYVVSKVAGDEGTEWF